MHTAGGGDPARADAGDADEADVLRERCVGEGVEDAADDGAETVGAQPAGEILLVDLRPVISPSARNMPTDSIITTIITMHMVMIGTRWNCGMPNRSGDTKSTQGAVPTLVKLITPMSAARTAPATMPSSTETLARKPVPHLISPRITTSTNSAMASP